MKNKKVKKKNIDSTDSSGIRIGEVISISVKKKKSAFDMLKIWIIALAGCYGTLSALTSLFELDYDHTVILIYGAFAFLISAVVFSMRKYAAAALFELGLAAIWFIITPKDDLVNGAKCFINGIVETANLENKGIVGFYISRKVDEFDSLTVFMTMLTMITVFLICYGVIAKRSFSLGFVFSFPLVEVGLFFGLAPDYAGFACLLAFWLALVALNNSSYHEYVGANGSDFVRKGNFFMPKYGMKNKADSASSISCFAIALAVFSAVAALITAFDVERSDSINELRYTLKHELADFSLEDIVDLFTEESKTTNYGKLSSKGNVKYENKDMLELHFDEKISSACYLKGYVGSVYDGDSWDELDAQAYKELDGLYGGFKSKDIYPQTVLSRYIESYYDFDVNTVTVGVINAPDDFCYTPYATYYFDDFDGLTYEADTVIRTDDIEEDLDGQVKSRYTFQFMPFNCEALMQSYCQRRDAGYLDGYVFNFMGGYDDFVQKYYTQISYDENLMSLYENPDYSKVLSMYSTGTANEYETLCAIREVIQQKADYTLSPGSTPRNEDFVYYFLEENGKGYCVHYASAGVMLARMAGIPARYVTGYIVDSDKFSRLTSHSGGYTFTLKDNASHAWAEVYIKGLGWIPFEFTEGYSRNNNSAADTTQKTTTSVTTVSTHQQSSKSSPASYTAQSGRVTTTSTAKQVMLNVKKSGEGKGGFSAWIIGLSAIAFVLLVVLSFPAARKSRLKKRKMSFKTKSSNKNAINAYRYLTSLLEFCGIEEENRTPLEYARYAQSSIPYIEDGALEKACKIAMRADFSLHEVTEHESESIVLLSKTLAKRIYESKGGFERFRMKYIERLI